MRASCLKIGGELSGANCPGGESSDIQESCKTFQVRAKNTYNIVQLFFLSIIFSLSIPVFVSLRYDFMLFFTSGLSGPAFRLVCKRDLL